jgi:two-component system invasion response regulator UvrY
LMDIQMPKTNTMEVLEYILIKDPATKVLIFSMSPENIYAKRFLKAGAKGFISKEASLDHVMNAIELVLNGRVYISESLIQTLAKDSFSDRPENPFNKLSAREFNIASLLLSGHTSTDISRSLHLQPSTVGTHKSRLYDKLGVTSILELNELARFYNIPESK